MVAVASLKPQEIPTDQQEREDYFRMLRAIPLDRVLVFDTETTGTGSRDEVIQASFCDGNGDILLNELVKPWNHYKWPDAQRVHGISPMDVIHKPFMSELAPTITRLLDECEAVVTYNGVFDIRALLQSGVEIPDLAHKPWVDVMKLFAPIYGQWDSRYDDWKWQHLGVAADYYGFKFHAHDAAEDIRATAAVYRGVIGLPV
ncbi:3'-5' exonuclease [Bifidobacterium callitrichidarum]|uniref:3'-5' exonuclease n=1 Tax=Bifidobacterium callitrichidarum TaxID=2052941 RepID=A0A2U2N9B2_9BIFI|nr:3'-5' exonuclease [Bifidobacterium callitrichidarum]PWG65672.1 3'-5' exonuclease [Bifidobacterium callitrichidarum]